MGRKYNGVMFDIDGVLEFRGEAYPGAVELLNFLRKNGVNIRILSNSTRSWTSRASVVASRNRL